MSSNSESWTSIEKLAEIRAGAIAGAKRVIGSNRITDPDDVASQVVMELGSKGIDAENFFFPRAYRTARWRAISALRGVVSRRKADSVKAASTPSMTEPANTIERDEQRQQLVEAMLATPYGEYVFGRYVLNISAVTVGAIIDATVKPRTHQLRLRRALQELRRRVSDD